MGKPHAIHNEKVCDHLSGDTKYFDWIVTTAFYSALHYVQYEIFPIKESITTYPTFEKYYTSLPKKNGKPTKHEAQIQLTAKYLPSAGAHYRFLHDNSWSARYRTYNIPKSVADTARIKLQLIKAACDKE